MKALKLTGKIILGILAVILLIVLALPLWIGPTVRGIANSVAPKYVGTDFNLGSFGLNPYSGSLHVGDMQLANPPEYSKENCVELGTFDVNVSMGSLFSKKIRIEEVVLDGLTIATTAGGGNFRQIAKNVEAATAKKPGEGGGETAQSGETASVQQGDAKAQGEGGAEVAKAEGEPKRMVIDKLVLKNIRLKYGMVPVPLPTITMEGIGEDKPEGATISDVYNSIIEKVSGAASSVGVFMKDGAIAVSDAALKHASAAADAAKKHAAAAGEAVSNAASAATEAAGNAAAATGEAMSNAASAVGEHASKVTDSVSSAASSAADAAAEHTSKAVEGIKNLFK